MNPLSNLEEWLDIRPGERRPLLLCFLGAFLIIGFMILARSIREAMYLGTFDVKTLPYITVTTTVLSLPMAALFTRLLLRFSPQQVLKAVLFVGAAVLAVLWPMVGKFKVAVVLFYLWTALGAVLVTSGFWIVVAEYFPLRGAKRLFGFISAGGTAGAMVFGTSLSWLTKAFSIYQLIPLLIFLLAGFFLIQAFLPQGPPIEGGAGKKSSPGDGGLFDGLKHVLQHPHLRSIAIIVGVASLASTLLDYQFKELVRGSIVTKSGLASFFGAFYGWTGAISLFIQLVLTSRILSKWGIGWALAILPLILFLGSTAMLVVPGILLVTAVRGMDNSLRKSLHRAAIEVLYVPLPAWLRRKTKTFIDTTVDSLAEGLGGVLVFTWVTWGHLPSRYLSVGVAVLAAYFAVVAYRINQEYRRTLIRRLKEEEVSPEKWLEQDTRIAGQDLLSGSLTQLTILESLKDAKIEIQGDSPRQISSRLVSSGDGSDSPLDSEKSKKIWQALNREGDWQASDILPLLRLLPRDAFYPRVVEILSEMGAASLEPLANFFKDKNADFVTRRRLPRIFSKIADAQAGVALLEGLASDRFEIRYRSAIGLVKRIRGDLAMPPTDWPAKVWEALRFEVNRGRAVWEIQGVLDQIEDAESDSFLGRQVRSRGELSMEHSFRLMTLVLEPVPVKTSYEGILLNDPRLKSLALEYLETALPPDIRKRLWPFIGDISEAQRQRSKRPMNEVVEDLLNTGATLLIDPKSQETLRKALGKLE